MPLKPMGAKTSQNRPFPREHVDPHLIHPSLDRPHSPSQMASRSNQPFCHRILSGPQTQTQIDRWDRWQVNSISAYALLIESDVLIIAKIESQTKFTDLNKQTSHTVQMAAIVLCKKHLCSNICEKYYAHILNFASKLFATIKSYT